MIWWVNDELYRLDVDEMRKNLSGESDDAPVDYLAWLIEQAERGDITPLRIHFPRLRKFLHLPKRKRGESFPRVKFNPVRGAADDVKRIRALWMKHYKRKRRPTNDLVTAEQIAGDRWKVDVEAVINKMKKASAK
jgi:hypothetical protein